LTKIKTNGWDDRVVDVLLEDQRGDLCFESKLMASLESNTITGLAYLPILLYSKKSAHCLVHVLIIEQ
jgi:hypothetical protein